MNGVVPRPGPGGRSSPRGVGDDWCDAGVGDRSESVGIRPFENERLRKETRRRGRGGDDEEEEAQGGGSCLQGRLLRGPEAALPLGVPPRSPPPQNLETSAPSPPHVLLFLGIFHFRT